MHSIDATSPELPGMKTTENRNAFEIIVRDAHGNVADKIIVAADYDIQKPTGVLADDYDLDQELLNCPALRGVCEDKNLRLIFRDGGTIEFRHIPAIYWVSRTDETPQEDALAEQDFEIGGLVKRKDKDGANGDGFTQYGHVVSITGNQVREVQVKMGDGSEARLPVGDLTPLIAGGDGCYSFSGRVIAVDGEDDDHLDMGRASVRAQSISEAYNMIIDESGWFERLRTAEFAPTVVELSADHGDRTGMFVYWYDPDPIEGNRQPLTGRVVDEVGETILLETLDGGEAEALAHEIEPVPTDADGYYNFCATVKAIRDGQELDLGEAGCQCSSIEEARKELIALAQLERGEDLGAQGYQVVIWDFHIEAPEPGGDGG